MRLDPGTPCTAAVRGRGFFFFDRGGFFHSRFFSRCFGHGNFCAHRIQPALLGVVQNLGIGGEVSDCVDDFVDVGQEVVDIGRNLGFLHHDLCGGVEEKGAGQGVIAAVNGGGGGFHAFHAEDLKDIGVLGVVSVAEVADGARRGEVALGAAVFGHAADREVVVLAGLGVDTVLADGLTEPRRLLRIEGVEELLQRPRESSDVGLVQGGIQLVQQAEGAGLDHVDAEQSDQRAAQGKHMHLLIPQVQVQPQRHEHQDEQHERAVNRG